MSAERAVLAVIDAHQYLPSLARGVSKCSCGLQLHGMPHDYRLHLADEITEGRPTTWDCDNFTEPTTCLSAGVSEAGRCGRCVLRLALARETVRLAGDDPRGPGWCGMRRRLYDPDHCTACGDFPPCGQSWIEPIGPDGFTRLAGDGDRDAVWDHLYELPMKVLRDAADEMEAVIADGDCAESAAPVSGEVGRSVAVARRDALYEEPHEWLRAYATRLADAPTTTRAATDLRDDEGGVR